MELCFFSFLRVLLVYGSEEEKFDHLIALERSPPDVTLLLFNSILLILSFIPMSLARLEWKFGNVFKLHTLAEKLRCEVTEFIHAGQV